MNAAGKAAGLLAVCSFVALGFAVGTPAPQARPAQSARAASQSAKGPASESTSGPDLAVGKKVFVARCGSCHDADGSKTLPEGLPLNKRPITDEKLTRNVNGRLKDTSEAERAAVLEYIKSFRKSPAS